MARLGSRLGSSAGRQRPFRRAARIIVPASSHHHSRLCHTMALACLLRCACISVRLCGSPLSRARESRCLALGRRSRGKTRPRRRFASGGGKMLLSIHRSRHLGKGRRPICSRARARRARSSRAAAEPFSRKGAVWANSQRGRRAERDGVTSLAVACRFRAGRTRGKTANRGHAPRHGLFDMSTTSVGDGVARSTPPLAEKNSTCFDSRQRRSARCTASGKIQGTGDLGWRRRAMFHRHKPCRRDGRQARL